MQKEKVIVICGPTASGKTALSIELAKIIGGEIISADSIQVYKYMNIGSAKISQNEMDGIKHYLIDVFEPDKEFNVHIFKTLAQEAIHEIYDHGKIPIIAGGTGFYIQSVLYDIQFDETNDAHDYRHFLEKEVEHKGKKYLHELLEKVDPQSAEAIHFNNVKRVIRALEYYHDTGIKISEHNIEQKHNDSPYNFAYFVLNDKREHLYDRINKRVDKMISQGLEDEVRTLVQKGYN